MPNVKQVISNTKRSLQNNQKLDQTTENKWNCRKDNKCPLDGKCLTKGVIYQSTVTRWDTNKDETCIGLPDNSFKTRFNGHTCSVRNEDKRNATTLSQYIWKLKGLNIIYTVKWRIVAKGRSCSTSSKNCNLCLKEK